MAIFIIFVLGIGNFALHRAVMESGHNVLRQIPWYASGKGRKLALMLEFAVLLAAMLLAADGSPGFAWGYLIYSAANGMSGWLILTGRI
ncbi:MAG: hypothetical protein WAT93_10575 [Pontixanthobacter sp.]